MDEHMHHQEHEQMADEFKEHTAHTDHKQEGHSTAHADHKQGGHATDHTGHEQMFRTRFWWSLLLSVPVLLYSAALQNWLGFSMPAFPGSEWISFGFSLIVFAYGGVPFLKMAVPELRNRKPGMMMLISLAISVALVYSVIAQLTNLGEGFFWELVTLIDIMLLGHWLEMRSVRQASGALDKLVELMPDEAERIKADGTTETVPVAALQNGDLLLIRPGDSVPADGEVVEGESSLNEAMITGESRPVKKSPGDEVIGGTINGDGSLRVRVSATGDDTALAGIMRLVEQAQQSKSETQVLADKAAGWLFYIALSIAALTAVGWGIAVGFDAQIIKRVVTVLVIACPHALGLAVPLVVAITTALGASNGILVRDRLALEAAREIDVIVFDKTGTLTKGEFGVVNMQTADDWPEDKALALAAAIEGDSEHLIAKAIRQAAQERELSIPEVEDFSAIKGRGVKTQHGGENVYVGGPRLLEMLELENEFEAFGQAAGEKAQSVIYLTNAERILAAFAVADVIRPESKPAVDRLHDLGVEVAMLTGDSQPVAESVAAELGIDHVFAEVLPENKDKKIAEFQKQGKHVAMVGDGANDAPALTRADVGIAIGGGTDVAIESAGLILVRSNPLDVVSILALSRASYRKMIQNLWWAAGYNIVALPLAAGVLAPWGVLLSPAVGALLMSLSTIIVAINAQLLRRATLSV
ncbi:MAG: copper-translocating P-type ATPase [Anaerolineales bacterium]|nr:copper-translocating P-type ATPase [Anaerolineales bacterium]